MDAARLKKYADSGSLSALEGAITQAAQGGVGVALAHVVNALLGAEAVVRRLDTETVEGAKGALAGQIASLPKAAAPGSFAFPFGTLFEGAIKLAEDAGNTKVTPTVLMAAALSEGVLHDAPSRATTDLLRAKGLTVERFLRSGSGPRRDYTYAPLGFGQDLTARYRDDRSGVSPMIGMEQQLRKLVARVAGGTESLVLIGEPGVGKSQLAHGLAYHLAKRTRPMIPEALDDVTVISISIGAILSDTGNRGELETRVEEMLAFFAANRTVIPFFDEIHTLLDVNEANTRTISNALKPPMASGAFRCIGATTDQEYARFIAGDRALKSRFTPILIPEPDFETSTEILARSLPRFLSSAARDVGIEVPRESLERAVSLTQKYQRSDRLPRKAIRLVQASIAEKTYSVQTGEADSPVLTPSDVATSFSAASGIPTTELESDGPEFAKQLGNRLLNHVRGQDPAIDAVTGWLQLQSFGWTDPRRPRGRFLFLGPPGVGKTELATALAAEVMHDKASVIVKNMAEFKGDGAKTRWMGADPGYVGFGTTETVYSKVMMRPYSVIVMDEVEKAHASLADPMLSILDGAAEDGQGRWVDFSQCIFVMTSNAIQVPADDSLDDQTLRAILRKHGGIFTPPFVDRLDRIVLFQPLDLESLAAILDILIEKRRKVAARPLPESIDTPEARSRILEMASSQSGATSARGLERALAQWLSDQAAALMS